MFICFAVFRVSDFVESKNDQIVLRSSMGRRRSEDVVAFLAVLYTRISMVIPMDR
jgi:hypothetical protein